MDAGQSFSPADQPAHRHPTLIALTVLVAVEALGLLVATVISVVEIFRVAPEARGTMIALAVVVLLLFAGLAFLVWGIVLGRRHLLGAVITWQFMQIAAGIVLAQGLFADTYLPWWTGLLLIALSVAAIVLSVVRPVTTVLAAPYRSEVAAEEAKREAIRQAGKATARRR